MQKDRGTRLKCINVSAVFFRVVNAHADRVEAKAGLSPSSASIALAELSKASYKHFTLHVRAMLLTFALTL
jgi:hypothetical protein